MLRRSLFFAIVALGMMTFCMSVFAPYVVAEPFENDDEMIRQMALEGVIQPVSARPTCETEYQLGEYRHWRDWAFLSVVCWPAEQVDPDVKVPSIIILAAAERVDGRWLVHFEDQVSFIEAVNRLPTRLVNTKAKLGLLEATNTGSINEVSPTATSEVYTTGLPWQVGTKWYYRTSIHGGNNALDFASPNGVAGAVRAADKGTVVWAYETCMLIRRPDGLQIGYQHIAKADIRSWKAGSWVNKGQRLGATTRVSGCSGTTAAHHVHFWLQGISPNGSKFGGWTLQNPYLTKPGISRSPSLSLVNSAAILYDPNDEGGPAGYTFCARENEYCSFSGTAEVAYGAQGSFNHKYNVVGGIACNNATFGDPLSGVVKACYTKGASTPPSDVFQNASSSLNVTLSQVRLDVCADNLPGRSVNATLFRGPAAGTGERLWRMTVTAPTNERCITFVDMDGAGNTLAGITYYTVASFNPISDSDAKAKRTSCFSATGGRQLCDARSR